MDSVQDSDVAPLDNQRCSPGVTFRCGIFLRGSRETGRKRGEHLCKKNLRIIKHITCKLPVINDLH
ncbi:hypothetical protein HPG69_003640 [Diceros bicornis minor]|uniref:Uncharacterized protein n=1 Tax=Diceros bicornis minor TaxID=77932 RepID=A0A7J7ET60_DICBM|nr:hypothetical protein HPG69_003640 [Diceros bicornis minor]